MSYIRHTIVSVQPGEKDAFLSQLTTQLDSIKSTAGLMGIRVVDAGNNRVVGTTVYDSKESADAASRKCSTRGADWPTLAGILCGGLLP